MEIELGDKLNWNLESILEGKDFEEVYQEYLSKIEKLVAFYETGIFHSKESLFKFHMDSLECEKLGNRVTTYLENKIQENLINTQWIREKQRLKIEITPFLQKLSDFEEKAYENSEFILEYLETPTMQEWKRYYQLLFKRQKHELPSIVKKTFAAYSPAADSYEQIFSVLVDVEVPVKTPKDSKKVLHKISNREDFIKTQLSEDRSLRKNAYFSWYNALNSIEESLSKILYYHMLEQNISSQIRGFEGGFYEERMFVDEISNTLIPYIYKKVAKMNTEYKKYKNLKKVILKKTYGLKAVKPWDWRMPVIKNDDHYISIEKAQEMTIEALSIFGEKYVENLQTAFNERWIDWIPKENKSSGAYCSANCFGINSKFILMNYNYRLEGVYTLVHELGHAMHSLEFCSCQKTYASTTIFLAEIPSTLNELMLSFHLLNKYKDEPRKKFEVYDHLLDNFFASTTIQAIYSDWEYETNRLINQGRVLDSSTAKLIHKAKQEKYSGKKVGGRSDTNWKEISLVSILTIPHFYSGEFYVYKYIVGKIVALKIATEIYYNKNTEILNKYFEFLKIGESMSNIEALKILNINLEKGGLWDSVKKTIRLWIKEYKSLMETIDVV